MNVTRFAFVGLAAVAIIVALSLTAIAQTKEYTSKEVTEKLEARSKAMNDGIATFKQRVKFGFSKIEQTFEGTVTIKKPKSVRIESEHQTVVTDGVTVWAYSPVNHQVIIDNYKEDKNSISPENFLLNIPQTYFVAVVGTETLERERVVVLKLVPKDDRSIVKSVKVWVKEQDWTIGKVEIVDINETETIYSILSIRFNNGVAENTFTFVPPPNVDIVDLRK
jgi:chaperone LolA